MDEPLVVYTNEVSGTTVLLAVDTWADESSEHRLVALKCVRRGDKLAREVTRRQGLSSQFVVPVLRVHVGAAVAEEAAARQVPPHVAVLARCDGTLDAALAARPRRGPAAAAPSLAGRDWDAARRLARGLIAALAHIHEEGLVHCDVRPSNVAAMPGGAWKLLDLDGAVDFRAGEYVSERCAAAYAPPEGVYIPDASLDPGGVPGLKTVAERGVLEAWAPASLKAHPSFDAWSLGAVLYHVVADCPLWPATAPDGSLSAEGLRRLAAWDDAACEAKLAPLLREPLSTEVKGNGTSSAASRDAAVDLLRYLLSPKPRDRPAHLAALLRHSFVDPSTGLLRAQLHREAQSGSSTWSGGYGLISGGASATGLSSSVTTALLSPGGLGSALWRGMSTALAYTTSAATQGPPPSGRQAPSPSSDQQRGAGSAAPKDGGDSLWPRGSPRRKSLDREQKRALGQTAKTGTDPVRL